MSDLAISIRDVSKSFKKQKVLENIDLDIESGTYFGLIGVNGAGKSTLIKGILDFISIDTGEIKLFDLPHTDRRSRERLCFLPEKFLAPYYLVGEEFLRYMANLRGQEYDAAAAIEMLEVLDLEKAALSKPVRKYSKGMAQKLGLAACLLSGRKLFILDEPMSGLDPKARAWLKRHLLELKTQGRTLFFSTHMLADIQTLCDKVAILHEGVIRFIGSPGDCCEQFGADSFEQAYLRCVGAE